MTRTFLRDTGKAAWAWASQQSHPIASRSALVTQFAAAAKRFGISYSGLVAPEAVALAAEIARPPHWGGYRLYASAVELWVEGEYRIHDRARWDARLNWTVSRCN